MFETRHLQFASLHLIWRLLVRPGLHLCNVSTAVKASLEHCNGRQKHAARGGRGTLLNIINSAQEVGELTRQCSAVNVLCLTDLLEGKAAPCRGVARWDCSL